MSTPKVHVEMYRCSPGRRGSRGQRYRWRAKNAGNNKILATASEAYTNEADCIDAIWQLFGGESAITLIRQDLGEYKVTPLQAGTKP